MRATSVSCALPSALSRALHPALRPALHRALQLFTVAAALSLYGCAPVHWHKADADDAGLAQDLAACRQQAQRSAGAGALPSPIVDPRLGAPLGPSPAEQRMQESQALGRCMRGKGYSLVAGEK